MPAETFVCTFAGRIRRQLVDASDIGEINKILLNAAEELLEKLEEGVEEVATCFDVLKLASSIHSVSDPASQAKLQHTTLMQRLTDIFTGNDIVGNVTKDSQVSHARLKRQSDERLVAIGTTTLVWGADITTHYGFGSFGRPTATSMAQVARAYGDWTRAAQRINAAMLSRHTSHFLELNPQSTKIGEHPGSSTVQGRSRPIQLKDLTLVIHWRQTGSIQMLDKSYEDRNADIPDELQKLIEAWVSSPTVPLKDIPTMRDYDHTDLLAFDRHGLLVPRPISRKRKIAPKDASMIGLGRSVLRKPHERVGITKNITIGAEAEMRVCARPRSTTKSTAHNRVPQQSPRSIEEGNCPDTTSPGISTLSNEIIDRVEERQKTSGKSLGKRPVTAGKMPGLRPRRSNLFVYSSESDCESHHGVPTTANSQSAETLSLADSESPNENTVSDSDSGRGHSEPPQDETNDILSSTGCDTQQADGLANPNCNYDHTPTLSRDDHSALMGAASNSLSRSNCSQDLDPQTSSHLMTSISKQLHACVGLARESLSLQHLDDRSAVEPEARDSSPQLASGYGESVQPRSVTYDQMKDYSDGLPAVNEPTIIRNWPVPHEEHLGTMTTVSERVIAAQILLEGNIWLWSLSGTHLCMLLTQQASDCPRQTSKQEDRVRSIRIEPNTILIIPLHTPSAVFSPEGGSLRWGNSRLPFG